MDLFGRMSPIIIFFITNLATQIYMLPDYLFSSEDLLKKNFISTQDL